ARIRQRRSCELKADGVLDNGQGQNIILLIILSFGDDRAGSAGSSRQHSSTGGKVELFVHIQAQLVSQSFDDGLQVLFGRIVVIIAEGHFDLFQNDLIHAFIGVGQLDFFDQRILVKVFAGRQNYSVRFRRSLVVDINLGDKLFDDIRID